MITETGPASAARAAFVAARTSEDLAKACDALMDLDDVGPEDLAALKKAREAALLTGRREPATSCACGFGPILAEADRKIAARSVDALPLYEREAKERMLAGKKDPTANRQEGPVGEAAEVAAKDFGAAEGAAA